MSEYLLRARRVAGLLSVELTPELKRRIGLFTAASLGIGLLAVFVLRLIDATFDPFAWAVLVCIGAAYGWFAHSHLAMSSPSSGNTMVSPLYDDACENDNWDDEYNAEDKED